MTARRAPQQSFELQSLLPTPNSHTRLRPWLVFAAVVIFAFFGLIFSRVSLDRSGFELDELEQQIAIEEARRGDLRAEAARLQDPVRITEIAIAAGLVYPEERIELEVRGIESDLLDTEYRWAQLKAVLTAQP
jgi:cell division protein FtsL